MDKNKFFLKKIKKEEKTTIFEQIVENYGAEKEIFEDKNLYINQKNKVYFTHIDIDKILIDRVNCLGIYFGTLTESGVFRLSIEATQLFFPKKNYVKVKKEKFTNYIAGENLFPEDLEEINTDNNVPFLITIYKNKCLGTISIKEDNVQNYLSKARRLEYNKVF